MRDNGIIDVILTSNRMSENFRNAIEDKERLKPEIKKIAKAVSISDSLLKEQLKLKAEEFALFFDQYILDAIDAILKIKPEQIGKRYIDRKLIDESCDCQHQDEFYYQQLLCELLNSHLDNKKDDYEFTTECFGKLWEQLWGKYKLKEEIEKYPEILQDFELFLQQFSEEYREHFVHQFQVFLLGIIILNKIFDDCLSQLETIEIDQILENWLLASSIHDLAYPLQEYDKWSSYFFEKQLNIKESLSFLELSKIYVEKSFSGRIEEIIREFKKYWTILPENGKIHNSIRCFFYHEIVYKKNHGLMSALYLLKILAEQDQDIINKFLPAALAMALHDDEIWETLSNQTDAYRLYIVNKIMDLKEYGDIEAIVNNKSYDIITQNEKIAEILFNKVGSWGSTIYRELVNLTNNVPLPRLCFEKQPVAFLLLLCDNLQECGRPCMGKEFSEIMQLVDIRLKEVVFQKDSHIVTIKMEFNNIIETSKYILKKQKTLEKIAEFLYSENIKFNIEFWARSTKEKPWFTVETTTK